MEASPSNWLSAAGRLARHGFATAQLWLPKSAFLTQPIGITLSREPYLEIAAICGYRLGGCLGFRS
jgi:hypothetical protein